MNYTIDERGIHFEIDESIPLDEAVKAVERIAEKNAKDLAQCTQTTLTTATTQQST
jgi:hypothetical protein